jgi:hypothetical protein
MLLVPLLAAVLIATPPEPASWSDGSLIGQKIEYPVFLLDGREMGSSIRPLVGFGGVRLTAPDARTSWIPVEQVDLDRSREAWAQLWRWDVLDKNVLQGKAWPALQGVTEDGIEIQAAADAHSDYTAVVLWRTYCTSCHYHIGSLRAWRDREHLSSQLHVVTVCVEGSVADWKKILMQRGLTDARNWTNVHVAEPPSWVDAAMQGAAATKFLLSRDGHVVHSNILDSPHADDPVVLNAVLRPLLGAP